MPFKYSICHVDQPEIEYPEEILTYKQVREMVLNYPWVEHLKKLENLESENAYYSPSLDFTNLDDNYSFCLSAGGANPEKFTLYIWYNRPVMKKILFGLMGEKEVFDVIDKWFSVKDAHELLDKFLMKEYRSVERKMNGK